MTNKEAIDILKSRKTCMECVRNVAVYEKSCNECNEAFDMAIKALKILELDDIDIDGTYWLYYDDNGNLRENKE